MEKANKLLTFFILLLTALAAFSYDEANSATIYEYDERGNLVETARYDCNDTLLSVSQTLYDEEGRVVVSVGPFDPYDSNYKAIGTENVYDDLGRVVKTRRWADVEILTEYVTNDDDEIVAIRAVGWISDGNTPADGNELSYSRSVYDDLGRVASSVVLDEYGDEQATSYEYDAAGRQVAVVDPCGYRTETHYENGRRAWVVDARGCLAGADPNDYKTRFVYDAAGRIVTTVHPATVFADSNGAENTYSHVGFDALGRKLWQTGQTAIEDPNVAADSDESRWFEYDAAGRLTAVILPPVDDPNDDPDQGETVNPRSDYFYDEHGNMVGIWDPNLRLTVFKYDQLHNQTHRYMPFKHTGSITSVDDIYSIDLSGKEFSLSEYDELSRLVKVTDFNDHITIYEYNNRSQLEYERHYESEGDYNSVNPTYNANPEIYYQYDNYGKRTDIVVTKYNGAGQEVSSDQWSYAYDEYERLASIDSPQTAGVEIGYDYNDITGRMSSVRTPDTDTWANVKTQLSYTYDSMGRLDQVIVEKRNGTDLTPSSQEITTYTYNPVGSVNSVDYANGNIAEYSYDALNRLKRLDNWKDYNRSQQDRLSSFDYVVAVDGMRTEANEIINGQSTIITWDYDNLNRVIYEDYNAPGGPNDYTDQYTYDLVGNRWSWDRDGDTIYYFYNDTDQLTKESANSVGSDPCVTYAYNDNGSLTQTAITGGDTYNYTYNLRGRMASVSVGGTTVNYKYNHDGIRIQKAVSGGATIDYIIDPYNHTGYAQVMAEDNGTNQTHYIIGHDILAQAGTNLRYLTYDGHGSTRQLADSTGAQVAGQKFNYDAYGNLINNVSPATNLLYVGQMRDTHTGFYYDQTRWYDPATGRFNRSDDYPGSEYEPQSLHRYLYAHCNPINGIDPTGQFTLSEINLVNSIRSGVSDIDLNLMDAVEESVRISVVGGNVLHSMAFLAGINAAPFMIGPVFRWFGDAVDVFLGSIFRHLGDKIQIRGSYVHGVTDQLAKIFKKTNKSKMAIEAIGELGSAMAARAKGFKRVKFKRAYHGIDQIWRKGSVYYIVEGKGGTGHLASGQMGQRWIRSRIERLAPKNPQLVRRLRMARGSGRLKGMVVKTKIVGRNKFKPKFQIKSWTEIGLDTW